MFLILIILRNVPRDPSFSKGLILLIACLQTSLLTELIRHKFWSGLFNLSISYFQYAMHLCAYQAVLL